MKGTQWVEGQPRILEYRTETQAAMAGAVTTRTTSGRTGLPALWVGELLR